ncbi:tyrosine-protein phosphatase non-receptor type substrate 1-like [Pelmatolapia mariae]|uniref:tyrosine-protein phosphatase non-receptor type substrate 1-like n=1 Tax=Pelmatolapia mariae TaxID=158779 RepID=UPI002FE5EA7D
MIFTGGSILSPQRSCKNLSKMCLQICLWLFLALTSIVDTLDYKNIISPLGQQVILPCNAPGNMVVLAMQWSRRGLEEYVLNYRDDQLDPEGQDPSYTGRVNLTNTQNGNFSMILMNMMTADIGTYECVAFQRRPGMDYEILSIINLNVSQSDEVSSGAATGRNHLIVSLSVIAGIILVAGILYIYIRYQTNIGSSPSPQYEMTSTSQHV